MLVQLAALVFSGIFNVFREPFIELIVRVEEARHDEMQECPKLYQCTTVFSTRRVRELLNTDLAWSSESECQ